MSDKEEFKQLVGCDADNLDNIRAESVDEDGVLNALESGRAIAVGAESFRRLVEDHAQWQSRAVAAEAECERLRDALKGLSDMYAQTWDLVDGGLMMFADSVPRFEAAHEKAQAALSPPAEPKQ